MHARLRTKILTLAATVTLSGAAIFAPVTALGQGVTIEQLQAQIAQLQAQLQALLGQTGGSGTTACAFTRSLTIGVRGDDVTCLQNYLTGTGHFTFSGGATGYFGSITRAAVATWQAANGVSPAAGYFGPISRAKYSQVVGTLPPPTPPGTTPPPPGTPPPPAGIGTGLTITAAANQPEAQLAPLGATRIPFTSAVFTASADGDVTINSITAERQGVADDDAFAGVVLLDESGNQIGTSKTLNSVHQVVFTEPVVVKAGTSRTLSVGGNTLSTAPSSSNAGQLAKLAFVAVGATSGTTVNGSFPIVGNAMTINESLTIGTVTMQRGGTDPGSSQTKEVGTLGYTFSSVKTTAGSAEKVYLKFIRWNQTGSAASGDLANVKTYVDGATAYDAVVSSDGKYYTTTFTDNGGKGILMEKGFGKELTIKGDILGGSGRTIDFDLAKRTDIGLVGENYHYGITPPQTGSSDPTDDTAAFSSVEDPWYDAAQVTISTGSITISTSNAVPAQNIGLNLPNTDFGAFTADVKGEEITVATLGFNITLGAEDADSDVNDLTNVTLVDDTGNVVAGPVDGNASDTTDTAGSGDGVVVFSTTVTFKTGLHIYKLRGKVGTDFATNTTIVASTTPSSDFATVKGVTTGNTVTPGPTSAITFSTMTVKSGALTMTVSSVPIAQTVVANTSSFTFANYILDVTASGEDVRLVTIPLEYNVGGGGSATSLSNCQLFDGANSVTTGSNVKNPTAAASSTSFTFDGSGLVIAKGTSKTITLKCNIAGGATGFYEWGFDGAATYTGASGVTSGETVVEVINDSEGQRMTAATGGTLEIGLDSGSPSSQVVNSGATNVELLRIRYTARNEDIDVRQVALQLSTTASNTPIDLVGRQVTLWDATSGTQIGTAVFPTEDYATSSLIASNAFRVTRDVARVIIVKGDIAAVTASGPLTASGDRLVVDYDGNNEGLNGNYGTGVSSGSTITPAADDTAAQPARIFKAYPRFAYIALPSTERSLTPGTTANKKLYRFSVQAVGGDVAMYKFTFAVSSSTAPSVTPQVVGATTSLFSLYSFTTSDFATEDPLLNPDGLINFGQCFNGRLSTAANAVSGTGNPLEIYAESNTSTACNTGTTTYRIPAGVTRYFELRGTTANVEAVTGQESFTVQLEGDTAFPSPQSDSATGGVTTDMNKRGQPTASLSGGGGRVVNTAIPFSKVGVDNDTNDDLIWSPISTTSAVTVEDLDYTNGFILPGLPSGNMPAETFTSPN
ncbi:MAG: SpoIID/LytB protein [Parcubacteria group bacterium Gr01-1014_66]|nr:MAG: SpoIID/LytB protein [Parcubacteria group bacterium Gr01-1014_66]